MEVKTEIIDSKKLERAYRRRHFKEEFKRKVKNTWEWCKQNPEMATLIISGAFGAVKGVTSLGKSISRNVALHQEKIMRDTRIYDRSLGKYVELKRPLKQSDMNKILERRDQGEKLSNILMDMNLVK